MNGNPLIFRDQRLVNVGTTDGVFMGSNPRRRMLIISCPVPTDQAVVADNTLVAAASTATTGVKASYTVPAGVQAELESATVFSDAVAGVVSALQLVRAATTFNLASYTTNGQFLGPVPLQAGDVIQWNCTTSQAVSTSDYSINVRRNNVPARVSISFIGPAKLDEGINLYAGGPPVVLLPEDVAQGVREEIRCIGSITGLTVGVVELSYG
jgi:hypothetical protein